MDPQVNPQAGVDALEHLAYLIAEEIVAELNLQTGHEMLGVMKDAGPAELSDAAQLSKLKTRAAGGR